MDILNKIVISPNVVSNWNRKCRDIILGSYLTEEDFEKMEDEKAELIDGKLVIRAKVRDKKIVLHVADEDWEWVN